MIPSKTPWILVGLMALAGCAGSDHADLRQWMADAKKDMKPGIPPLPKVKPYEPSMYMGADVLDPFSAAKIEAEKKSGGVLQPDLTRPKEPLESYPLDTLRYVGFMRKQGLNYAIIQADNALHQVKIGNYMGQNFGIVADINESEVSLKELVQDSAGEWSEKTNTLPLLERVEGPEGKK